MGTKANKCQFWTPKQPKCSNNGTVWIIYGEDAIGRVCRDHVETYKAAYPLADFRFEDNKRRLIHMNAGNRAGAQEVE